MAGPLLPAGALKTSVALCTHNGEQFLPEQLHSLARQTTLPYELVVLDDASTDDTISILEDFRRKAPFPVRIERSAQNKGWIPSFFAVIGRCQGDLVATCDQDDVWSPVKIERCTAWFDRHRDLALLVHSAQVVDAQARPTGVRLPEFRRSRLHPAHRVPLWFLHEGFALVFPTWLRDAVGIDDLPPGFGISTELGTHTEHDYWACLVAPAAGPVVTLADDLVQHRRHGANASHPRAPGLPALLAKPRDDSGDAARLQRQRVGGTEGFAGLLNIAGKVDRYRGLADRLDAFGRYLRDASDRSLQAGRVDLSHTMAARAQVHSGAAERLRRRADAVEPVSGRRRRWSQLAALALQRGYGRRARGALGLQALLVDVLVATLGPKASARLRERLLARQRARAPLPTSPRRVSVALCTYNGAAHLRDQLDSLASQTRPVHELVVLDDVSTDDTTSILEEFARHSPFPVRLNLRSRNQGYVTGYFEVMRQCTGDLIALCDQDDVWSPDKIERCTAWFDRHPEAALLVHSGRVVDARLRDTGVRLPDFSRPRVIPPSRVPLGFVHHGFSLVLPSWLLDVAELDGLPLPLDPGHDSYGPHIQHDWWVSLVAPAAGPVLTVPDDLVLWRRHGGNRTPGLVVEESPAHVPEPAAAVLRNHRPVMGGTQGLAGFLDVPAKVERYRGLASRAEQFAGYLDRSAAGLHRRGRAELARNVSDRARRHLRAGVRWRRRAHVVEAGGGPVRRLARLAAIAVRGAYGRRARRGLGPGALAVDLVVTTLGPPGCRQARTWLLERPRPRSGQAGNRPSAAKTV